MFGDNKTVVDTASTPHGKLHKHHNALSFHKTRFAITAGVTTFHHVSGDTNPADVLSKHWDFASVWKQLKPILFWKGDTAELIEDDKEEGDSEGKSEKGEKAAEGN